MGGGLISFFFFLMFYYVLVFHSPGNGMQPGFSDASLAAPVVCGGLSVNVAILPFFLALGTVFSVIFPLYLSYFIHCYILTPAQAQARCVQYCANNGNSAFLPLLRSRHLLLAGRTIRDFSSKPIFFRLI